MAPPDKETQRKENTRCGKVIPAAASKTNQTVRVIRVPKANPGKNLLGLSLPRSHIPPPTTLSRSISGSSSATISHIKLVGRVTSSGDSRSSINSPKPSTSDHNKNPEKEASQSRASTQSRTLQSKERLQNHNDPQRRDRNSRARGRDFSNSVLREPSNSPSPSSRQPPTRRPSSRKVETPISVNVTNGSPTTRTPNNRSQSSSPSVSVQKKHSASASPPSQRPLKRPNTRKVTATARRNRSKTLAETSESRRNRQLSVSTPTPSKAAPQSSTKRQSPSSAEKQRMQAFAKDIQARIDRDHLHNLPVIENTAADLSCLPSTPSRDNTKRSSIRVQALVERRTAVHEKEFGFLNNEAENKEEDCSETPSSPYIPNSSKIPSHLPKKHISRMPVPVDSYQTSEGPVKKPVRSSTAQPLGSIQVSSPNKKEEEEEDSQEIMAEHVSEGSHRRDQHGAGGDAGGVARNQSIGNRDVGVQGFEQDFAEEESQERPNEINTGRSDVEEDRKKLMKELFGSSDDSVEEEDTNDYEHEGEEAMMADKIFALGVPDGTHHAAMADRVSRLEAEKGDLQRRVSKMEEEGSHVARLRQENINLQKLTTRLENTLRIFRDNFSHLAGVFAAMDAEEHSLFHDSESDEEENRE